jgi:hypothetical protein
MMNTLTNALNKTINNAGGPKFVNGSVIQAHNEPIWYVNFLTRAGGSLLLEVLWRDGGVVGSVLNDFKISQSLMNKLVNHFLKWVDISEVPPLYDFDEEEDIPDPGGL